MLALISRVMFVLVCLLHSLPLHAATEVDPDLYQVEVIIFEHTDPKRFDAEVWPKFIGNLDIKNAIPLNNLSATGDSAIVSLVDPGKRLLNADAIIIKKSKEQRFIEHISWSQKLVANLKSQAIYIQAGKDNKEIEATLAIKPVRNLFEVNIDLIYNDMADNRQFRITRDIKVRKNEMYYLDHPIIGMMLIVSRILE